MTKTTTVQDDGSFFSLGSSSTQTSFTQDLKGAINTFGVANIMAAQQLASDRAGPAVETWKSTTPKEKWSQAGKISAGGLMALCFVGEPCGAIEAGLSLVVGAAALGETVSH
jgi:hypothetical protein